ncbi:MAG: hypothetical protein JWM64_1271 [Frankiales bacterium]|nr:hypothetical protein [Frankiales bacterium]
MSMQVRPESELVPVLLPEPLRTEAVGLHAGGDEVAAVRVVREQTGLDLSTALRAVRAASGADPR